MKYGKSLQELAIELDRQNSAKKDLLVDTPALSMTGGCMMTVGDYDYSEFGINDTAHRQIGTHLGIPSKYYDKMRTEDPDLLAINVNSWFHSQPSRQMVRTLDGTVRAFLSERYRRIDNFEVAQAVLPIIGNMFGAAIKSCELTERKMYIKVVDERIQDEVRVNDIVQAGVVISNSEIGYGCVNVSPLIYRLACSNGMIVQDAAMRKYHVGRTNEQNGENFEIYRSETIEADDRAFLMKLEDTVRAAVDEAQFRKTVDRLRETTETKIAPASVPQVVELMSTEFTISQDESKGVLGHLISGGDLSLYGLANAVTRFAQDVESYDRSTELEAIGYRVINIAPGRWANINEMAVAA